MKEKFTEKSGPCLCGVVTLFISGNPEACTESRVGDSVIKMALNVNTLVIIYLNVLITVK